MTDNIHLTTSWKSSTLEQTAQPVSSSTTAAEETKAEAYEVPSVPKQKNWLEETKNLAWTSVINLETLSLGAISTCFDFSPEQIILLLLVIKVTLLMLPTLIPALPATIFLVIAGALLAVLLLLLLATMASKAYKAATLKAEAKKATEEAATKAEDEAISKT